MRRGNAYVRIMLIDANESARLNLVTAYCATLLAHVSGDEAMLEALRRPAPKKSRRA